MKLWKKLPRVHVSTKKFSNSEMSCLELIANKSSCKREPRMVKKTSPRLDIKTHWLFISLQLIQKVTLHRIQTYFDLLSIPYKLAAPFFLPQSEQEISTPILSTRKCNELSLIARIFNNKIRKFPGAGVTLKCSSRTKLFSC